MTSADAGSRNINMEQTFDLGFEMEENKLNNEQNDHSPVNKRFKVVTENERKRILDGLNSENTKNVTKKSVFLLTQFYQHNAQDQLEELLGRPLNRDEVKNLPELDLAAIHSSNLCILLSQFWLAVRTEKGELYKANSLQNIRHGINRRIKELRDFDIIQSPEFAEANVTFKAQMRELKRTGKADTTHHQPLTEADLSKVYDYFEVS